MPRGDRTKAPAFQLWRAGKSLEEIQGEIGARSKTKPSSVAGWVRDWERGRQGTWPPNIKDSQQAVARGTRKLGWESGAHEIVSAGAVI